MNCRDRKPGVPFAAQQKWTRLGSMRVWVQSLASLRGLRIQCCCELRRRSQAWLGLVLQWLWLWCWPAATSLIRPLAWDIPYAVGAARRKEGRNRKSPFIFIYRLVDESAILKYLHSQGISQKILNNYKGKLPYSWKPARYHLKQVTKSEIIRTKTK